MDPRVSVLRNPSLSFLSPVSLLPPVPTLEQSHRVQLPKLSVTHPLKVVIFQFSGVNQFSLTTKQSSGSKHFGDHLKMLTHTITTEHNRHWNLLFLGNCNFVSFDQVLTFPSSQAQPSPFFFCEFSYYIHLPMA